MRPWRETAKSTRSAFEPPSTTRCASRNRRSRAQSQSASPRASDCDRAGDDGEDELERHSKEKMTWYSRELLSVLASCGTGSTSTRSVVGSPKSIDGKFAEGDALRPRPG